MSNKDYLQAAKVGNIDKVKACIEEGIDMYVETESNGNNNLDLRNALQVACEYGNLDIAKYLIETFHFHMELKEIQLGRTALHLASGNGQLAIVQYLVGTCCANKEAPDRFRETALFYAGKAGYLDIVKYLIEDCTVNPFVKNSGGSTAYDVAQRYGMVHVTNYLTRKVGSDCSSVDYGIILGEIEEDQSILSFERSVSSTTNRSIVLPTIYDFSDEYTIDDLPWYVVVIGTRESRKKDLGVSCIYRKIRDNCNSIPLEVLYYKILQVVQQPKYATKYRNIPAREDQLLFVYWDTDQNIFRPLHLKSNIEGASRQDIQDIHVGADMKKNGTSRELSTEERKYHLGILLKLKRQAIELMAQSMDKQIVSNLLSAIEEAVHVVTTDYEIEKLSETLTDTWERFFPKSVQIRKKKEQLLVRIQQKRQAIEPMAQSMDGQILSNMWSAVEEAVEVVTTDRDIRTLSEHVKDTCERFFPSNKKQKKVASEE